MTEEVFKKGLSVLAVQFPEKNFDASIMWDFLKDLTDEQYMLAINKIITTQKEINRATNIVALIREQGLVKDREIPAEAWSAVLKEVSRTGSYGVPKFSNPLITRAVECIGWRNICLSENPGIERAHFLKIYEQLQNRENLKEVSKIGHIGAAEIIHQTAKEMR